MKLIMPEIIVDIDLVKALIKAYNPLTHRFHKKYKSILCTLDRETFIELFDLGGPMTKITEQDKINETFKNQKSFFTSRVMRRHIPKSRKERDEFPKKVGYLMPLDFLSTYF